jgi:hypothetical protein
MNRWGLVSLLVLALAPSSATAQDPAADPGSGDTAPAAADDAAGSVAPSPAPSASVTVPAGYAVAAPPEVPDAESELASPPRRVFGLGTALGGGVAAGGAYTFSSGSSGALLLSPAIEIHSLEAMFFFSDHLSLDVSIPLGNTLIVAAATASSGNPLVPWGTNLTLDFSIGDDWVRFIVGPSVGLVALAVESTVYVQLGAGALVGLELLTRGRAFGFRVMTRPQVQFALPVGGSVFAVGGLALLEVGFIGYIH